MLDQVFFNRDPTQVAQALLGKECVVRQGQHWLRARIIETEAYYLEDKASHASLGFTQKRKALFMPAGTIYMYYARGGDSLNISCRGPGNAVLIKSGFAIGDETTLINMQQRNPIKNSNRLRPFEKLCSGQTLLCKSLGLKVPNWDQKNFDPERFFMEDVGYRPETIIQTTRLGIPPGRDEHLPYRFLDLAYKKYCTKGS